MKKWKRRIKSTTITLFNTKTIKQGYSLIEMVLVITISSLLMTAIVSTVIAVSYALLKSEEQADRILKIADCFDEVCRYTLSPNIYPHIPHSEYEFSDKSITFFANNKEVTFDFDGDIFTITQAEPELDLTDDVDDDELEDIDPLDGPPEDIVHEYKIIKDFHIKYYDNNDFSTDPSDEQPYYCRMKFVIFDNREVFLDMRL